ncbi:MAG: sulfite exporter TauE/SafE family protein [Ornithinibacter sp.]
MPFPDASPLLVVSFAVGIVVGLTGMGGGALMTPALIFLGVPPTAAVANDLVAAAFTKSVGAGVHWRRGSPDLRLAGLLSLGSVPTAFAGAWLVRALGTGAAQQDLLRLALGATLLLTATTYVLRTWLTLARRDPVPRDTSERPALKPTRTVALGAGGGLLVGVTSVGSGSLIMVCLLLLYPALAARRLVGTDLVQAIPLVVSAAISHVLVTGIQWAVLLPLLVGGMPGTFLGARLCAMVSPSLTRRGIAIVLTLTGLTLLGAPPLWVGSAGIALAVIGPVGWAGVRRAHGAPAFHRLDPRAIGARLGRAG